MEMRFVTDVITITRRTYAGLPTANRNWMHTEPTGTPMKYEMSTPGKISAASSHWTLKKVVISPGTATRNAGSTNVEAAKESLATRSRTRRGSLPLARNCENAGNA